MANAAPDFVDERPKNGIIWGMDIGAEALIQNIAFPDMTVDIKRGGKGEKGESGNKGHRDDKNPLPPDWPINRKSP